MFKSPFVNTFFSIATSLLVGALVIFAMGYSPAEAYSELFKGAFVGKLNFGNTLERFTTLLLTSLAFTLSARVNVFNMGVEGQLYLGAIAAAWVGAAFFSLPFYIHIPLCLLMSMAVGALWAAVPGALKAYYRVNEACVSIMMNYIAIFLCSYLVAFPLSAMQSIPKTADVAPSALLHRFLWPSRAHVGLFMAIAAYAVVYWVINRTTWGYSIRSVGLNPDYSEYVGIDPKRTIIGGMLMSGVIGGLSGGLEVLGIYGHFLDGFSVGMGFDGILASHLAKNDLRTIPFTAFFLAALKAGALGMERFTGIPKSLVDALVAVFILLATMEGLFNFVRHRRITA